MQYIQLLKCCVGLVANKTVNGAIERTKQKQERSQQENCACRRFRCEHCFEMEIIDAFFDIVLCVCANEPFSDLCVGMLCVCWHSPFPTKQ